MKGTRNHKEFIVHQLRDDEKFRKAYLTEALNEDEPAVVLSMLRDIAEATKNFTRLAKETGLARQSLYKVLAKEGNPEFKSVWKVVRVLRKSAKELAHAR
jgi:probable addiction module antidote protein